MKLIFLRIKNLKIKLFLLGLFGGGLPLCSQADGLPADVLAALQARQTQAAAQYSGTLAQLQAAGLEKLQAPGVQAAMAQAKARGVALQAAAPGAPAGQGHGQILIFVSSSLPHASLVQWLQQANALNAPLILRGLVHDSLPDTKAWLRGLLAQTNKQGGIQINPALFQRYNVQQVPAVVVAQPAPDCAPNQSCRAPGFDVVTGNASLQTALATLAEKGAAAPGVAKAALVRLNGESAHE